MMSEAEAVRLAGECPSCAKKDAEIVRLNAVINGLITGQANAEQRAEAAETALAMLAALKGSSNG